MRLRSLSLGLAAGALTACGGPGTATMLLDFQPAARTGGDFVLALDGEETTGCALDGVARFEVRVSGPDLEEPMAYDIGGDELAGDCQLRLLVPEGIDRDVEVEAYDADDALVRKGWTTVTTVTAGEIVDGDLALWPASRHVDAAGDASGGPDLVEFDVVRQSDRWLLVLRFADSVRPANDGGASSVAGFMVIADDGSDRTWRVSLDATRSDGLDWVDPTSPVISPDMRLPFEFADREMRINLPYGHLGATAAGTTPAASAAIVLQANPAAGGDAPASDALPDAALSADGSLAEAGAFVPLR